MELWWRAINYGAILGQFAFWGLLWILAAHWEQRPIGSSDAFGLPRRSKYRTWYPRGEHIQPASRAELLPTYRQCVMLKLAAVVAESAYLSALAMASSAVPVGDAAPMDVTGAVWRSVLLCPDGNWYKVALLTAAGACVLLLLLRCFASQLPASGWGSAKGVLELFGVLLSLPAQRLFFAAWKCSDSFKAADGTGSHLSIDSSVECFSSSHGMVTGVAVTGQMLLGVLFLLVAIDSERTQSAVFTETRFCIVKAQTMQMVCGVCVYLADSAYLQLGALLMVQVGLIALNIHWEPSNVCQLNALRTIGLLVSVAYTLFASGCHLLEDMGLDQQGWIRCGAYFGMPVLLCVAAVAWWCKRFEASFVAAEELSRYINHNAENRFESAGKQLSLRQSSYHAVRRALELGRFNPVSGTQLESVRLHDSSGTIFDLPTIEMLLKEPGHGLVKGSVALQQLRLRGTWRSEDLFAALGLSATSSDTCCISSKVHADGASQLGHITTLGITALQPDSLTIELITQLVDQNANMKVLKCPKNMLNEAAGIRIAQLLQTGRCSLTEVDLSHNLLTDAAGIVLADAVQKNHGMKMVSLHGNLLGEASGRALGAAIAASGQSMSQLLVHHNADAERPSLSGALLSAFLQPGTRGLHVQPLSMLKKGQKAFQVHVFFIEKSRPSLTLTVDTLGDAGALAFFEAVQDPKNELESVTIEGCALGPASSCAIQQACLAGVSLQRLSLRQCTGLSFGGSWFKAAEPKAQAISISCREGLRVFDLQGCKLAAGDGKSLAALLGKLKSLASINLANCDMGDKDGNGLSKCLSELPLLTNLNLQGNRMDHCSLGELQNALRSSKCLKALNLSFNKFNMSPVDSDAEYLAGLRQLNLSHNSLGAKGAEQLAKALQNCTHELHEVRLESNFIPDSAAAGLLDTLTQLELQTLDLSDNAIGALSAAALITMLQQSPTLKQLYLGNNQLGHDEESVGKLFESLSLATSMVSLSLANNSIGDAASAQLSRAVAKMNAITNLDLSSNPLGHTGGCCLAYGVHCNKSLLVLNLSGTSIGMLPDGKVWSYIDDDGQVQQELMTPFEDGSRPIKAANRDFPLGKVLATNESITTLDLSSCKLTESCCVALGRALRKNTTLECLSLDNNDISDQSGLALLRGAIVNKVIVEFHLARNPNISNKVMSKLAARLKRNQALAREGTNGAHSAASRFRGLMQPAVATRSVSRTNDSSGSDSEEDAFGVPLDFELTPSTARSRSRSCSKHPSGPVSPMKCLEQAGKLQIFSTCNAESVDEIAEIKRQFALKKEEERERVSRYRHFMDTELKKLSAELAQQQRSCEAAANCAMQAEEHGQRLAEQHAAAIAEVESVEREVAAVESEKQQAATEAATEKQQAHQALQKERDARQRRIEVKALEIQERKEMAQRVALLVEQSRRQAELKVAAAQASETMQASLNAKLSAHFEHIIRTEREQTFEDSLAKSQMPQMLQHKRVLGVVDSLKISCGMHGGMSEL